MKLIVGLGNPGRKYAATRHNIGFEVLAELAQRFAADKPKAKFDAELTEVQIEGQRVLLLWPLTYMNRSGGSVQPARDFYKVANDELLVVCDDLALPFGKIRIRGKGGAGGHNGLKSIIESVGSTEFARVRLGILPEAAIGDAAEYVLTPIAEGFRELASVMTKRAGQAILMIAQDGLLPAMNTFNGMGARENRRGLEER